MKTVEIRIPPITVEYVDASNEKQANFIARQIEMKFVHEPKWRLKVDAILDEMVEEVLAEIPH